MGEARPCKYHGGAMSIPHPISHHLTVWLGIGRAGSPRPQERETGVGARLRQQVTQRRTTRLSLQARPPCVGGHESGVEV